MFFSRKGFHGQKTTKAERVVESAQEHISKPGAKVPVDGLVLAGFSAYKA